MSWRSLRARRRARHGEDGFILMESLIAISLITVILAALGSFTLRTVQSTSDLRARQSAAQVATTAMASVAALPPGDLATGRDQASVDAQFADAPRNGSASLVAALDPVQMTQNLYDKKAAAGAGSKAAVPTSPPTPAPTLNGVTYSVNTYLGTCVIASGSASCLAAGTGITYFRVVVAVLWSGRGCSSGSCSYVTSTLINSYADPVFNTNRAVPPTAPVVDSPGAQVSTKGAAVSVQLAVKSGTGVPPYTWRVVTGTLPAGLTLSASGLVDGTPTTVTPAAALGVEVTDAFGRTATDSFTWQVVAPPTVTAPAAQTSPRGRAVSLAVVSTCPNAPCTFSIAGAPSGLTIDAATGKITGTPTVTGTSPSVTVTITDAVGATATSTPFSWTVTSSPPTVTSPGAQSLTVGTTVSIPIPYTCPTPSCTITLGGAFTGLTLTNPDTTRPTAGQFTTPGAVDTTGTTNLSQGKTATQSSVNFSGAPARAVDGNTDGNFNNASVSHSDYQAQPWWQVDLGTASLVRGVRIWNRTDCCDTRLSNFYVFSSPTDMSSKTIAQLFADPTVTVAQVSGLNGQPNLTVPLQSSARFVRVQLSGTDYLSLAEVQVLGTADTGTSVTVGATSGTVYATGVVPASAVPTGSTSKAYSPSLGITDLNGATATSAAGVWTVFTAPTIASVGTRSVKVGSTPNTAVAYTCPNVPCTLSLTGTVPGIGLSANATATTANGTTTLNLPNASGTVYVNGLVSGSAVPTGQLTKAYAPTLTITDKATAAATSTGAWTATRDPSPVLTNPGSQAAEPNQTVSLQMSATCPSGGCTWQAAAQVGSDPTWIPIPISSSGLISNAAPGGNYTVRVIVTDSSGNSDTVSFPLTVQDFALTVPNLTSTRPGSGTKVVTFDASRYLTPAAGDYTWSLSGQPSWLSVNPSTGLLTATIGPFSGSDTTITLTAVSNVSGASRVSDTFAWTLS